VADYDSPTSTYDSGLTYDAAPLPQPYKVMAKVIVKMNLRDKSDADLLVFAQQHEAAMTGNANFTAPMPNATEFAAVRGAYDTALAAFNAAQQAARQATTEKDTARAALEDALTRRGNYVAATTGITPAKVQSAGFSVKSTQNPATVPGTVMNLFLTAGDTAGGLDIQWDPTSGATRYEVQLCPAMEFATGVISLPSVSKSKTVATGLASGTRIWARAHAGNAAGFGPWSDVATKIVP